MTGRCLTIFLFFFVTGMTGSAGFAASPPRMRPYTGIGLVVFSQSDNVPNQDLQLQLLDGTAARSAIGAILEVRGLDGLAQAAE